MSTTWRLSSVNKKKQSRDVPKGVVVTSPCHLRNLPEKTKKGKTGNTQRSCLKIWFDVLEVSRQYLRVSTATRHCAEHKDRVEGEQHSRRASTQAPLLYGNLQVKYRYHYKAAQTTSKTTRAKAPLCTQIYRSKPDAKKKAAQATSKKQHVKTPFYTVIYRKNTDSNKKASQTTQKSSISDAQKSGTSDCLTPQFNHLLLRHVDSFGLCNFVVFRHVLFSGMFSDLLACFGWYVVALTRTSTCINGVKLWHVYSFGLFNYVLFRHVLRSGVFNHLLLRRVYSFDQSMYFCCGRFGPN